MIDEPRILAIDGATMCEFVQSKFKCEAVLLLLLDGNRIRLHFGGQERSEQEIAELLLKVANSMLDSKRDSGEPLQ